MQEEDYKSSLPLPTIRRYPTYLREIKEMITNGVTHISSAVLAEKLGLDHVLTRKDLAMVGVPGRPRHGYPAKELEAAMVRALGWDNTNDAALIGVGSLGQALLGYTGFKEHNLSISAAFDTDPRKVGKTFHGVTVQPISELCSYIKVQKLHLGILTVPKTVAQECAEKLIAAGVVGIWNFTPVQLSVPPEVTVQNVDLAESLAVLSHTIAHDI